MHYNNIIDFYFICWICRADFRALLWTLRSCSATVHSCSSAHRHNVRRNRGVYLFSTPSHSLHPPTLTLTVPFSAAIFIVIISVILQQRPTPPLFFDYRCGCIWCIYIYIMYAFIHKNIKYIYAHIYRCIIYKYYIIVYKI